MTLRAIKGGSSAPPVLGVADYLWVLADGQLATARRAVLFYKESGADGMVPDLPPWQVSGDLILSPCHYVPNPFQTQPGFLVLCETRTADGVLCHDNHRARLRELPDPHQTWWAFTQSWHGPHDLFKAHFDACLDAGLLIQAAQPGRFIIGFRGFPIEVDPEEPTALVAADHLTFARHLLTSLAKGEQITFSTVDVSVSTADSRLYRERNAVQLVAVFAGRTGMPVSVGKSPTRGKDFVQIETQLKDPYQIGALLLEAVNKGGQDEP